MKKRKTLYTLGAYMTAALLAVTPCSALALEGEEEPPAPFQEITEPEEETQPEENENGLQYGDGIIENTPPAVPEDEKQPEAAPLQNPPIPMAAPIPLNVDGLTVSAVETLIQGALDTASSGDILTVTGTVVHITTDDYLSLDIPVGVTLRWQARLTASVIGQYVSPELAIIRLTGDGIFELADGGFIQIEGNRVGIAADGVDIAITGGYIEADQHYCISSDNADITVSGGLVRGRYGISGDPGTITINDGADIKMEGQNSTAVSAGGSGTLLPDGTFIDGEPGNVIINGGSLQVNGQDATTISLAYFSNLTINEGSFLQAEGRSSVISTARSNVTINGGTLLGYIFISNDSELTINGGLIYSEYESDFGGAIHINFYINPSRAKINGGQIISKDSANAIYTTGNVEINGGFVFCYGNNYQSPVGIAPSSGGTFTVAGEGVAAGWKGSAGNRVYTRGTAKDIDFAPATASLQWATQPEGNGIAYQNGANKGFFVLPVTLTDYDIQDNQGSGGSSSSGKSSDRQTIIFNAGGDASIESSRIVYRGNKLTPPGAPTREGYTFTGWYTDSACTIPYDFDQAVDRTFTLYAGWQPINQPAAPDEPTEQPANQIPAAFQNPFEDVNEADWHYNAVQFVYEAGIMTGTSADTFAPGGTMTRGMFAAILWRLADSPQPAQENPFTDLTQNWYTDAAVWAYEEGIASGYGGGIFGPDDALTREQLAVMLYRYAEHTGQDVNAQADLSGYSDYGDISPYALAAIEWANAEGILTGRSQDTLAPQGTANRGETAAVVQKILKD